jgi:Cys-tRNA(Pro)/Cys-tRNA(Cys) deacylase
VLHDQDRIRLAGYVRGGVTALAAKRPYPVVVDEMILALDRVCVSAGVRGTQMVMAPSDYVRATSARLGPIVR